MTQVVDTDTEVYSDTLQVHRGYLCGLFRRQAFVPLAREVIHFTAYDFFSKLHSGKAP